MRTIMVLNAKGGCGKTTIATNLAAYYASMEEANVALADFDPQSSSLAWLDRRPDNAAPIRAIPAFEEGLRGVGGMDYTIIDAPARAHGPELTDLVRRAETIIVPVLPSPVDMEAGKDFIDELQHTGRVEKKKAKFAFVANRIRENTLSFDELYAYLNKQKAPFVATLRDAQNYVKAFERGLGVWELAPYQAWPDWEQWDPLIEWLYSRASTP